MSTVPAYIRIAEQIKADWFSISDPQRGQKLPTQEELAERYGVSRSTIVRVLSKLVAEGYIHSQQGSGVYVADASPREPDRKYISLIVPKLNEPVIVASCRGVERRARQLGYQVMLASSEGDLKHERELVEQHTQSGARGIVLYPATRERDDLSADYLVGCSERVPTVAMDIGCDEWPCSRVLFDNYRLGYDMTHQLLRHGHRRIAFMHTSADRLHTSIHDRQRGWEAAMLEAGLPIPAEYRGWPVGVHDYFPPMQVPDYEAVADSLLGMKSRPDAVIGWTDVAAAHLIQALMVRGVRVPDDVRFVGFDCEPVISRLFRPLFPTSKPDFVRLGELALEVLTAQLSDERVRPRTYYYPVPVLWRETRASQMLDRAVVDWDEIAVEV